MSDTSPRFERRKNPRLKDNIPIKLCLDEGDIVTETGNISRSGVYCKTSQYIEPMTRLKVNLLIPIRKNGKSVTKKIACRGVAVRTDPIAQEDSFNVAIFFNEISQRDAESISDYISSFLD